MVQLYSFYLFATVMISAAMLCIFARNPVHSVMWLIVVFFNASGLFLIAGAEFIAALLVIVYVGAVAVLFLFVVMMLDIEIAVLRSGLARYAPLGLLLGIIIFAEIIIGLIGRGSGWQVGGSGKADAVIGITQGSIPNIEQFGITLYTRYLFLFEIAGLILLVAIIGAIVLTHRPRRGQRTQNIANQIKRQPDEAVHVTRPDIGEGIEL